MQQGAIGRGGGYGRPNSSMGGQATTNQPTTMGSAEPVQQQQQTAGGWAQPQQQQTDTGNGSLPQRGTSYEQRGNMGQRGAFDQPTTSSAVPVQQQTTSGGGWTQLQQQQQADTSGGAFNQPTMTSEMSTPQQQMAGGSGWAQQQMGTSGGGNLPQRGTSFGQRGDTSGREPFTQPTNVMSTPQQQTAGGSGWTQPQQQQTDTGNGSIPQHATSYEQRANMGERGAFDHPTTSSVVPVQQQTTSGGEWTQLQQQQAATSNGGNLPQRMTSFGQRGDMGRRGAISNAAPTRQQATQATQLGMAGSGGGAAPQRLDAQTSASLLQASRLGGGGRGGYFSESRSGHETTAAPQQQPAWGGGAAIRASSSDGKIQPGRGRTGGGGSRPTNMPLVRSVEQLYLEDTKQASFYGQITEADEEVVVAGPSHLVMIDKWEDLEPKLDAKILENLRKCNYVRPRKIQAFAIPLIMDGSDLKGQSETGSGKTIAFLLPIIEKAMKMDRTAESTVPMEKPSPFAIIVEPTRELCVQVFEQAQKLANGTGVEVTKAYGEYNMRFNLRELNVGCDILCATPMRLQHLYFSKLISTDKLKFFVLDEADTLLDGDFLDVVRALCNDANFPSKDKRQTILFSATYPDYVEKLSQQMLRPDHATVSTKKPPISANTRVRQDFMAVDSADKKERLLDLLKRYFAHVKSTMPEGGGDVWLQPRVLVFVSSKRDADMLAIYLSENDIPSVAINSDRPQMLRERALQDIRENKTSVLVATDVMARGIDIQHLDHVINYDLPEDSVTYVHRIGRTGRMGHGVATSFFDEKSADDAELAPYLVKMVRGANQQPPDFLVRCAECVPTKANDAAQPPKEGAAAWGR